MLSSVRRCPRCAIEKPLEEFGAHRGRPNGKTSWCLECTRRSDRLRRERPEVLAAAAEYARRRRKDPAVKERLRITDAQWRATNHERRQQYDRSATKRAAARAYAATPEGRESRRLAAARRRAAIAGTSVNAFTRSDWAEVLDRFQHRCAYCLADGPLQIEHLQPLIKGGHHTKENIVPACRDCNLRKNKRDLVQFLAAS